MGALKTVVIGVIGVIMVGMVLFPILTSVNTWNGVNDGDLAYGKPSDSVDWLSMDNNYVLFSTIVNEPGTIDGYKLIYNTSDYSDNRPIKTFTSAFSIPIITSSGAFLVTCENIASGLTAYAPSGSSVSVVPNAAMPDWVFSFSEDKFEKKELSISTIATYDSLDLIPVYRDGKYVLASGDVEIGSNQTAYAVAISSGHTALATIDGNGDIDGTITGLSVSEEEHGQYMIDYPDGSNVIAPHTWSVPKTGTTSTLIGVIGILAVLAVVMVFIRGYKDV